MPHAFPRLPVFVALLAVLTVAPLCYAQPGPGVRFAPPAPGTLSGTRNVIYGIDQDPTGYLWIASEYGLHRYDGVEFVAFRADPSNPASLPGNRITGVSVAPDGAVWAAVDRYGVVRLAPETWAVTRYRLPEDLTMDPSVAVNARGEVWVTHGSWDPEVSGIQWKAAPVVRLDPEARTFHPLTGVGVQRRGLHLDAERGLWLVMRDGLLQRTATGWRRHPLTAPAPVRGAQMRVISEGQLFELRDGRFRPATVPPISDFRGDRYSESVVDADGILWTKTDGALTALHLDSGHRVDYRPDPSRESALPDAQLSELFVDRDGVLWIGTGLGLRTLLPGWNVFETISLGETPYATVLTASPSGRVWAGPACASPGVVAAGRVIPLAEIAPMAARAIRTEGFCPSNVLEQRDGTLWFTGWPFRGGEEGGGALRVSTDGTWRRYQNVVPGGVPHNAMRMAHEDATGGVWLATEGGLARYRPATDDFETFTHDPDDPTTLPATVIWSLADAPDGHLWVGTYGGGLALFDPATGRARSWQLDPGDPATLPSNHVTAIVPSQEDPETVWVGTYDGGLARFDVREDAFAWVGRADGLPDLTVKTLLEDGEGALWLGTDAGLVRYDPVTREARTFTEADGLPSAVFGMYDAAPLPDGRLAVVAGSHLVTFDPRETAPARTDAPVVLRSLRVSGQQRALPAGGEPLRLGPGERALAVEVAALSFRAPQRLQYAVRLDGADNGWVPLGTERAASWAGLAPGRYTLRARAGLGGAWSPNELALAMVVAPEWWQTGWFRLVAGLVVLGGMVWGVREASQRRLRAEVRRLETEQRLQAERERISRDLHDHVGGQLSGLIASAELARLQRRAAARSASPLPDGADALDGIEEGARETMRQLRETVWALHHEAVTLCAFRDRLASDVKSRLRGLPGPEASVSLKGDPEHVLTPLQALHLYRVAREAITNSLKHSGASRVAVILQQSPEAVTVEVYDDGTFHAGEGSGDGASGFGMGSMQARAEALGGTFSLATENGTTVRVSVPAEAPDARLP
ncbi:MAG: two-component regulator propeller domain-containing protein [Bacteroidota bacterium]